MIDEKLLEYVKNSLAQGKPKEEIYKELLSKGWTIEIIQESISTLTQAEKKEEASKKTIHIILTIAAVLVGAGIFSFIAANWEMMSRLGKMIIILVSMLGSYGAGWYLKEQGNYLKTGEALILLGSIIYGAGIFLVAQMFDIRANWPDGFILWMIGVIAIAFALESYAHFYLAIPLGFVAIIGHPLIIINDFETNPYLLTSSSLLLIATAVTFLTAWFVSLKIPKDLQ